MLIRLQQNQWFHDIDISLVDTLTTQGNLLLFPSQGEWNGHFFCENSDYASRIFQAILSAWEAGAKAITIRHERGYEYRNGDGDYLYDEPILEIERYDE